jgi:hypothetical protein
MRTRTHTRIVVALSLSLLLLTACKGILDVSLPGKVTTEALDNPLQAQVLANGVVLDFECAWSNYVTATNALSDQLVNASQQGVSSSWYLRNILPDDASLLTSCDGATGLFPYASLQIARADAGKMFATIDGFPDAVVTNKAQLKAMVRTYGAYTLVPLGEGYCSMVLAPKEVQTPQAILQAAETALTDALSQATAVNDAGLMNMARVGRARVRLDRGDFAGARTDASQVPSSFVRMATRGASERQRWNLTYEFQNNIGTGTQRHASVAPNFRSVTWQGVADPRVVVTANGISQDGVTPFFQHAKALSRSDGVPIASYKEAQLIVAEAAARTGDLATARQIINARHTAAGIPGYDLTNTGTQAQVIAQVIEERSRELFLEGGHRFNDMLRFRTTQWKIPFRGEAGSIHPNGIDQANRTYGITTCIPLPLAEQ